MHHPRSRVAVLACALFSLSIALSTTAQARQHVRHQKQEDQARFDVSPRPIMRTSAGAPAVATDELSSRRRHHHHARHRTGHRYASNARPRAWCGWWMRQQLGVADPRYNLARAWAGFGRPAGGPQVGAIVVWHHHVGRITGPCNGRTCVVTSGNDGHAVRTRPRSIAAAIAFRMP